MAHLLQGKVALVTGGSRGLGAATARALADAGADVAITYVGSADKAAEVVDELVGRGVRAVALQNDQADTSLAPQLINDVVTQLGGLDILINNAAISIEQGRTVDDPDADVAALDRMHATNYTGVIAIIRAAAKVLRDNGRIVTIGSGIATRVGVPGLADYAATKAGLVGYTRGVAHDLAPRGITVNMVQAGLMLTGMEPPNPEVLQGMVSNLAIKRVSEPAETAAAIAFLASPAASYITGAVLDSSGGYTA
ncbi:SDR family NAD(P)-dependent oxidoreductase [Micromonospora parathelypteridis]|uniref:NAD(P)-dependent dehydrogenase (Short-subunit alcohol dehydrogenase family) n=1 Tax=Micromonospora parathelypteridis TaxID=1839617 RepID=A0A840VXY8_9ACTN|nr:SDR family oxidoreductase [Micromonospora parathelypteridis]MBB5481507.1 NAD(P)-dependent dehydrogenase (short-subunit alcohol dehydrogenase family) [Micromonospora parathelypteridis]GGO29550.1 oxidoreductase [Micromonospora parathelypteridis]